MDHEWCVLNTDITLRRRLLAFIDRSNIGNAKIDGLVTDLKLNGNKFNISLVVFYVPYICVDVPSNWIVKHFKAGHYIPALLVAWGVVSMCTGFVKSYSGLLAARFFLGLSEGGILGAILVYLAMFYRRHQMLYRIGLFYCAAPLSGAFGGLLATGLAKINTGDYNGELASFPLRYTCRSSLNVKVGLGYSSSKALLPLFMESSRSSSCPTHQAIRIFSRPRRRSWP